MLGVCVIFLFSWSPSSLSLLGPSASVDIQPPRLTSSHLTSSPGLSDVPGTKEMGSADQQWDLPELQEIQPPIDK